jgi:thiol-disulfide isomerase/thioredoxin
VQQLAAIQLVTLAGEPARLDELLRGRVAVISLWATWCASCRDEMPALARLEERVRDRSALVLAIAVGEPHERVAQLVQEQRLPYAQLVDERFRFADALGQERVPATLIIDRTGRIVFSGGALDDSALAALRAALADTGPARAVGLADSATPAR